MGELLDAATRAVMLAAVLLVLGDIAARLVLAPRVRRLHGTSGTLLDRGDARSRALAQFALWALPLTLIVRALRQIEAFGDADTPWRETAQTVIGGMTWGHGWILQLTATILLLAMVRTRAGAAGALRRGIPGVALAVSLAWSGHAIGSDRLTSLAVAADVAHVLAGGAWIGTLALLLGAYMPAASGTRATGDAAAQAEAWRTIDAMVRAFSPVALAAAATIVVTGVFAGWLHVGVWRELWSSRYGGLLLAKVALVAMIAALGAWNWKRVTPHLLTALGVADLRRSATWELAIATVVTIVTAVLVATPLPGE